MNLALIITAAGTSSRFGEDKLFIEWDNKPLIQHTIEACLTFPDIQEVIITTHKNNIKKIQALLPLSLPRRRGRGVRSVEETCVSCIEGGQTRKDSVQKGVSALSDTITHVLVHDGARPFISPDVMTRLIAKVPEYNAVIPGLVETDTIKEVADHVVKRTLDRQNIYRIQTPQLFHLETLKKGYETALDTEATDEAMIMESMGEAVCVVEGDAANIKVTYPTDIQV